MISLRYCASLRLAVLAASITAVPAAVLAQAKAAPASKTPAKSAPKKAVKAPAVRGPAEADAEQLAAAQWVHYGSYECEFNQKLDISINPKYAAYADVKYLKSVYLMKPVLSSTGAIRLEDVKGQTVMIQIANKSMLMDVKAGRRLVDDCVGQRQRELMEAARLQREQQTDPSLAPEPLLGPGAAAMPAPTPAPTAAVPAGAVPLGMGTQQNKP